MDNRYMRWLDAHVRKRATAYRLLFLDRGAPHLHASQVLADLKQFCYADRSTLKVSPVTKQSDAIGMAMAEGRREVWNRIVKHLNLSDEEIVKLTIQGDL